MLSCCTTKQPVQPVQPVQPTNMSCRRFFTCTAKTPTTRVMDKDHLVTQVGNAKVVYSLDGRIAWIIPAKGSTDNWNHDDELAAVCEAASNMARAGYAKKVVHTDNKETRYLTHMRDARVAEWHNSFPDFGCTSPGWASDLDKVLRFCQVHM